MSDVTTPAGVTFGWHRWAAISLLRGTPLAQVIRTLVDDAGVAEADAASLCSRILLDPTLEAAKWAIGQLHKLESVLDLRTDLAAMASAPAEVPRRSGLGTDQFLDEFYSANRPVLLTDVCDRWPATQRWSPDFLRHCVGDTEVEVMADRTAGPSVEIDMDRNRTTMPFTEYVDRVEAIEWSNELYLVANNGLLAKPAARRLWEDFSLDPRYLDVAAPRSATYFWYGPAGTVTWLHHDIMNILFHQVSGWKHFVLISPLATHRVGNAIGVYSNVDPLSPDLAQYPQFAGVEKLQLTIGPGEALFIPAGWWHSVTSLETSISISATAFRFPNQFTWNNPTMVL